MKILRIFTILILFVTPVQSFAFSKVYIFGDSLSDTGNIVFAEEQALQTILVPLVPEGMPEYLPPPFYLNRLSNGSVAVDVLSAGLGFTATASKYFYFDYTYGSPYPVNVDEEEGTNYAVAGARARAPIELPGGLAHQIDGFLQINDGDASPDNLYLFMIGGNDVRDATEVLFESAKDGVPEEIAEEIAEDIIKAAVNKISMGLHDMYAAGAREFYVINSPDIGLIPETIIRAEQLEADYGIEKFSRRTSKLTQLFNKKLRNAIRKFERKNDTDVISFDLYEMSNEIHDNPTDYGLLNITDFCVDWSLKTLTIDIVCADFPYYELPDQLATYAFFDDIHPTGVVHGRIGQELLFTLLSHE